MERAGGAGRRIAVTGIVVSAALAALKITVGVRAQSVAVVSDGFESLGDVFTSGLVFFGLLIAARPPDKEHPYGHGRFEILTGLGVGALLTVAGALIASRALQNVFEVRHVPQPFAIWALVISIAAKSALWLTKRYYGRRIRSVALMADSLNDATDVLSATIALIALALALLDPRLAPADHIGGAMVGFIVIILGAKVMYETSSQLMDTMPSEAMLFEIRNAALTVPGALGIEKCYARKTGLRWHVDLHLEVDADMTVQQSHDIATAVRERIRERLDWVADVLVHVEPHLLLSRSVR